MARAEDMGDYFRVPADNRGLDYDKYFVDGEQKISRVDDYHSHNTHRMDVKEMKAMLRRMDGEDMNENS